MRRIATTFLAAAGLSAALLAPTAPPAEAQSNMPPHAWLFGTWTGGLFPVSGAISAQQCLAQPVVIFTKDIVLRASLTDLSYAQRVIETARTDPGTTDFKFAPAQGSATGGGSGAGLLGLSQPAAVPGFGCETPDVLHVRKRSDNEIEFPGCAEFPNPLVRCPSR